MDTNLQLDDQLWELVKQIDVRGKPIERYVGYEFLRAFKECVIGLSPLLDTAELKRLRRNLEARLSRYANWIRVDLYPYQNGIAYQTNFNMVFKTVRGTLYGHPDSILRPLFYTSHCLKRFEQRIKTEQYTKITSRYLHKYSRRATPNEILDEILVSRMPYLQFGLTQSPDIFINTLLGVLVAESFNNTYVAKSFLNYNYAEDVATWYQIKPTTAELDGQESITDCNIKDLLHHYAEPCNPVFVNSL